MSIAAVRKRPAPAIARSALTTSPCPVQVADRDLVIPASAHTLSGFRAWALSEQFPERGRVSYLDGEIFTDMSPEEMVSHARVKGEFTRALLELEKELGIGVFFPDGTLLTNEEANLSTEPDGLFVKWETLESGRALMTPREGVEGEYMELVGTPDVVLEVVSRYSVTKDTKKLRELYHRAGIPEYWLANCRGDDVDFQILNRGEEAYASKPGRGGWQPSLVFGHQFRLVRERGRMGLWQYTLESKARR